MPIDKSPQEIPKPVIDGDWPEDFSHENGNYQNRCFKCSATFIGHKRRVICKLCSSPQVAQESGETRIRIGDWIHSRSGVGEVIKIDEGTPWIAAGGAPGYGFPAYNARLATALEIQHACQGHYFTDPLAPSPGIQQESVVETDRTPLPCGCPCFCLYVKEGNVFCGKCGDHYRHKDDAASNLPKPTPENVVEKLTQAEARLKVIELQPDAFERPNGDISSPEMGGYFGVSWTDAWDHIKPTPENAPAEMEGELKCKHCNHRIYKTSGGTFRYVAKDGFPCGLTDDGQHDPIEVELPPLLITQADRTAAVLMLYPSQNEMHNAELVNEMAARFCRERQLTASLAENQQLRANQGLSESHERVAHVGAAMEYLTILKGSYPEVAVELEAVRAMLRESATGKVG